jgi:hypothetical protein
MGLRIGASTTDSRSDAMPTILGPLRRAGLSEALAIALACGSAPATSFAAQTLPVTSCADDNSAGTLRSVLMNDAQSGDTIDLGSLPSSAACLGQRAVKIALTTAAGGELVTALHDVTLRGPTDPDAGSVTISANDRTRVLHHTGGGTLHIENLIIADGAVSDADAAGGCIRTDGSLAVVDAVVTRCVLRGATSNRGGALFAKGSLDLTHSTVSASRTQGGDNNLGGGIYAYEALLTDSTISGNASTFGAGAYFNGYFRIERSTFDANIASTTGGALIAGLNSGAPFVIDSTISSNSANYGAGAVFLDDPPTIANSTIASNHSEKDSLGGESAGAGLVLGGGANTGAILESSIIAGNTSTAANTPNDLSIRQSPAVTLTGEHSLVMTVNGAPSIADEIITIVSDPKLGPLQNNGGPTRTHMPAWNSPAVGTGSNPHNLIADQRGTGFARSTRAGKTDIGAVQSDVIFMDGFDGG